MHYELHVPVKGIFPSPWVNTNGRCDVHLVHIPYEYFCFAFLAFLSQIFVGKKAPRMNDQGLSLLTSAQAILCCIRSISWCLTAVCHRLVYVVGELRLLVLWQSLVIQYVEAPLKEGKVEDTILPSCNMWNPVWCLLSEMFTPANKTCSFLKAETCKRKSSVTLSADLCSCDVYLFKHSSDILQDHVLTLFWLCAGLHSVQAS